MWLFGKFGFPTLPTYILIVCLHHNVLKTINLKIWIIFVLHTLHNVLPHKVNCLHIQRLQYFTTTTTHYVRLYVVYMHCLCYCCVLQIDMVEIKEKFVEMYKKPLGKFIEGDCSGDYKKILLALVGAWLLYTCNNWLEPYANFRNIFDLL